MVTDTINSMASDIKCSTVMVIHGSIIRDKCKSIDGFGYDEVEYTVTQVSQLPFMFTQHSTYILSSVLVPLWPVS